MVEASFETGQQRNPLVRCLGSGIYSCNFTNLSFVLVYLHWWYTTVVHYVRERAGSGDRAMGFDTNSMGRCWRAGLYDLETTI